MCEAASFLVAYLIGLPYVALRVLLLPPRPLLLIRAAAHAPRRRSPVASQVLRLLAQRH